jgi:hypothetical protein
MPGLPWAPWAIPPLTARCPPLPPCAAPHTQELVRVRPDRTIETLATAEHGLDFPADNAFDERWGEKKTLIWNNGGWNFEKPSVDAIDVGRRRAWVP